MRHITARQMRPWSIRTRAECGEEGGCWSLVSSQALVVTFGGQLHSRQLFDLAFSSLYSLLLDDTDVVIQSRIIK